MGLSQERGRQAQEAASRAITERVARGLTTPLDQLVTPEQANAARMVGARDLWSLLRSQMPNGQSLPAQPTTEQLNEVAEELISSRTVNWEQIPEMFHDQVLAQIPTSQQRDTIAARVGRGVQNATSDNETLQGASWLDAILGFFTGLFKYLSGQGHPDGFWATIRQATFERSVGGVQQSVQNELNGLMREDSQIGNLLRPHVQSIVNDIPRQANEAAGGGFQVADTRSAEERRTLEEVLADRNSRPDPQNLMAVAAQAAGIVERVRDQAAQSLDHAQQATSPERVEAHIREEITRQVRMSMNNLVSASLRTQSSPTSLEEEGRRRAGRMIDSLAPQERQTLEQTISNSIFSVSTRTPPFYDSAALSKALREELRTRLDSFATSHQLAERNSSLIQGAASLLPGLSLLSTTQRARLAQSVAPGVSETNNYNHIVVPMTDGIIQALSTPSGNGQTQMDNLLRANQVANGGYYSGLHGMIRDFRESISWMMPQGTQATETSGPVGAPSAPNSTVSPSSRSWWSW